VPEVFAGLDWGEHRHQLCVVNHHGERELDLRVDHDRDGLCVLIKRLSNFGAAVPVAIERAEGLLVERLLEAGHTVFPVNPRVAARMRERYRIAPVKDDVLDAYTLADCLRHEHEHWRPLTAPSPVLAELRALVRDRRRILDEQIRIEAQLRAILEAYHPGAAHLFSSIDRDVTLAFIRRYPTPEKAGRVGEVRMGQFLVRESYRGRVPAAVLVSRLRQHLVGAAPGTVAGKSRSALAFVELLAVLNRQLDEFDRVIAATLNRHPDAELFLSFPGVAATIAASLLAEIGEDRRRFPTPASLLAEAGLSPVTRASGRTCRVRFRYAANHHLRDAFQWWAYNSLRMSTWARDAYDQARARGQHHHRALRGLGSRWGRILWRCWQDGALYDEDRHVDQPAS
jgi:transposase